MMRSFLISCAGCTFLACATQRGEPPPPASSGTVVAAAPNATGAVAAGRASALPPSPLDPSEEEELDEDGQPPLPLPVEPDDGGVPL